MAGKLKTLANFQPFLIKTTTSSLFKKNVFKKMSFNYSNKNYNSIDVGRRVQKQTNIYFMSYEPCSVIQLQLLNVGYVISVYTDNMETLLQTFTNIGLLTFMDGLKCM